MDGSPSTSADAEGSASLARRSIASLKWSGLGELLSRSLQPILVLVVGSRLGPAEFGLLGIATIALGIAQQLQDAGLGRALILTRENLDAASNTVFWSNLGISSLMAGAVLLFAPWIGELFHRPDSVPLIRILASRLVWMALGAVQLTRMQRELRFRSLFLVRLSSAMVSFAVIVPLALLGFGVWSLVWGMVASAAAQTALLWVQSSWRPILSWDPAVFASLFKVSRWILFEAVFGLVVNWTDSVVVGWKLGDAALGKYRLAASALSLSAGLFLQPMLSVALPAFARLKGTLELPRFHGLVTRLALLIAGAHVVFLWFLGQDVVGLFLGPKWEGTAGLLTLLAAKFFLDWVSGFNSQAFTASGRPDLVAKQLMLLALVTLPVMHWAAAHGTTALATARVGMAGLDSMVSVALAGAFLGLGFRHAWQCVAPALGAIVTSALVMWALILLPWAGVARVGCTACMGGVAYLLAWHWLAPGGLHAVRELLMRKKSSST